MTIIKNLGKHMNALLKHKHLKLVLILMVTIYSALLAPALPNSIIRFFDTIPGKLLFIFLIGYTASKNIQVALIVAIGFVVTLQIVERKKIEKYINYIENFEEGDDGDGDGSDGGDDGDNRGGNGGNNGGGKKKKDMSTCIKTISTIKDHVNTAHRVCGPQDFASSSGSSDETEGFSLF